MLKLYTDKSFITPENRRIIFPLLFHLTYKVNFKLSTYYSLVDAIEEADIVVVPIDICTLIKNKKKRWLDDFIDLAVEKNKMVWTYSAGDFGLTLKKQVCNFRLAGFDSKLDVNTIILPSFISDPYESVLKTDFFTLQKTQKPKIGFVGNANNLGCKFLKEWLLFIRINIKRKFFNEYFDYQSFYPSSIKRYDLLQKINKNQQIQSNFILRKAYRAGVKNEIDRIKTTQEFFENIQHNQYVFCLRGVGNFSVRFYETLLMGRIPVLINTDVRLPLLDRIDWNQHCVIVSEKDADKQLLEYHQMISDKNFTEKQFNNRKLYQEYLKADSFFIHIHDSFSKSLNS